MTKADWQVRLKDSLRTREGPRAGTVIPGRFTSPGLWAQFVLSLALGGPSRPAAVVGGGLLGQELHEELVPLDNSRAAFFFGGAAWLARS